MSILLLDSFAAILAKIDGSNSSTMFGATRRNSTKSALEVRRTWDHPQHPRHQHERVWARVEQDFGGAPLVLKTLALLPDDKLDLLDEIVKKYEPHNHRVFVIANDNEKNNDYFKMTTEIAKNKSNLFRHLVDFYISGWYTIPFGTPIKINQMKRTISLEDFRKTHKRGKTNHITAKSII